MVPPSTSHTPPFHVPIRYMLTGVASFLLFAVLLLVAGVRSGPPSPAPLWVTTTHVLTLGALLSFAMGASYQLVTVAFLTPIASVRGAAWNYWLYIGGLMGLWYSMARWWPTGLALFGTVTALAVIVYAVIILASIHRSIVRGPIRGFIQAAHVDLILAVLAVLSLIIAMRSGMEHGLEALLVTHIVLAMGYFTFLIMGFTLKLLPMFTLAHGHNERPTQFALWLLHGAVWTFILGEWLWGPLSWIGGALAVAAYLVFVRYIIDVIQRRVRRRIEWPIRAALAAVASGAIGAVALLAASVLGRSWLPMESVVSFYLLGWAAWTLLGYAYKVVPFLVWTHRFGWLAGRQKVPLVDDVLDVRRSRVVYALYGPGFIGFSISAAFGWTWGLVLFSGLLATSLGGFCLHMGRVLDPKWLWRVLRGGDVRP
ncbi:hypothetical protein [Alicyclobacillus shizuokensis]|uniref:hypothetical protein n=1 Tax=Alicyclobacillus shizuokensis TaxID=392014 RepID=UPI00083144DD|nr:hypothetical protein [Alicyclobacillus shizuokensis]